MIASACATGASSSRGQNAAAAPGNAAPAAANTAFCNPVDIDYRFALDTPSRRDIGSPVITLFGGEYYLFATNSGGYWSSRDLHQWRFIVAEGFPLDGGEFAVAAGDGRIYYTALDSKLVYVTDDPGGGRWRADSSARSAAAIPGAAAFRDRDGTSWRVVAVPIAAGARGERRLGIVPGPADSIAAARALGCDAPQLLTGTKLATASSSLTGHPAALAFDGDLATSWSAATGGVGEWISVDLGAIYRLTALQVNFAEVGTQAFGRDDDSYQQYIVESSLDGRHWTTRIDESQGRRDAPHHYLRLDSARNARFVRITNVHAAAGGSFALRELRLFAPSGSPAPARR